MVSTNVIVDWISVTIKTGRIAPSGLPEQGIEAQKGLLGYPLRMDMPDGRIVLTNPNRPDMGTHVIYSGDTLKTLRDDYGVSDVGLAMFHHKAGHTITRIDVAMDVFDGFTAKECIERYENQECVSPLRKASKIQSITGNGDTLYLGARGGDRMVRIYDKAAQTNTEGLWTRIEGEYRAYGAKAILSALENSPNYKLAIPGILKGTVDYPDWMNWNQAMKEESIDLTLERKVTSQTEKWLLEKVAPSLAKFADEHDGFLEKFMQHVELMIQERKAN